MKDYYRRIAVGDYQLSWEYDSAIESTAEPAAALKRKLGERRRRDLHLGATSVGPHRDDIAIYLDGVPMRTFASQGEAKSAALAIKFAVYDYLSERIGERPLLLLDELASQLDASRAASLLQILPDLGQVFVTTARREELRKSLPIEAEMMIAKGRLVE
jgi:DNA replication and repair protein RecF